MTTSAIVLGIETSCDETAAAVVRRDRDGAPEILSNIVFSQIEAHKPFGGVVPEIAARAHVERIDHMVSDALRKAKVRFTDLDAVAATAGPGLVGGVIVGLTTGKAIAIAHNKPLIAVNHLEGHALSPRMIAETPFPYLLLLVSGGHTQLLDVRGVGDYRRLGSTIDDAAGEAFDKTAKILGLGYPGGPNLERRAVRGDPGRFDLPRPLSGRPGCDFSFSGLKTALRLQLEQLSRPSEKDIADLAASFQSTVADILGERTGRAMETFSSGGEGSTAHRFVVAGGVAANKVLRARLAEESARRGFDLVAPPLEYCTDNGAMIAWAGAERLALGLVDDLSVAARPRWPLDPEAAARSGHVGKKGAKA